VQWVAPKYREDRLLALGRWLEARFPVRTAAEPE
jgi:aspartyl-tRNA(Asn)/glutamyl-tRNA(Gln) amidotransferase subunit A